MPVADVVEGAITVGVNRALHTVADAAHHVVSTPTNMMAEGVKSATVFIATHVIMGGVKLGCTAGWWLITTAASLVGVAVSAGTTVAYNTFFPPQPKMITWNGSYDMINMPDDESNTNSTRQLEESSSTTPRAASPRPITNNVMGID